MDRGKLLLALLPLSVYCFDIYDFFSTPPPSSSNSLVYYRHSNSNNLNQTLPTSVNKMQAACLNRKQNNAILIKFSSLCSYRGTAMSIKLLVQKNFPGINVTLSHHPPARPKYIASKLISTAQVLIIMIVMAGKHIFVEMRMRIPSWYLRLTAHKFVVIAIPWLLGSIAINYLQNTEGFEIFFNEGLVFCKQQAGRFPRASEMREIIRRCLAG